MPDARLLNNTAPENAARGAYMASHLANYSAETPPSMNTYRPDKPVRIAPQALYLHRATKPIETTHSRDMVVSLMRSPAPLLRGVR